MKNNNILSKEKYYIQHRYKSIILVVLLSLFLVQRGGLLLFGYSHIAYPGFDETASGVLASDILDGHIRAPLYVYQYESRSGDGLIEGFLLVPFFKLFGRSLFSLKILCLSSSFLCLLGWIILMQRYYGVWSTIIFASLFTIPPPMFARLNLIGTVGSHHMINPLIPAQLLLLFRIIEGKSDRKILWFWLVLGFLSGLGSYTFYTYIIFTCFCIFFLLIFRSRAITFPHILLFSGGFFTGFSLWILKLFSSKSGASYLASILKNIKIDLWSFIQNFIFNLPNSFGYNYPSRGVGVIAPLFFLFIIFLSGVILKSSIYPLLSSRTGSFKSKLNGISPPVLQAIFLVTFPIFFLSCISLSPMKIMPFEYWPTVGIFGNFNGADVYRYRWLHLLYPFYFAIITCGISIFFKSQEKNKKCKLVTISCLIFFLLWGMLDSIKLYSKSDFSKTFYYKGYSYDQMGNRFILSDIRNYTIEQARQFTLNYPRENMGEAYRCLGTKVILALLKDSNRGAKLEKSLREITSEYVNDFIYGIIRGAQNIPEKEFHPFADIVIKKYPDLFYKNWGFRHLGYKYYSVLVNQGILLKNTPSVEQWFFRNFLEKFKNEIEGNKIRIGEQNLLQEIIRIPREYQHEVVKGIGKLVGAEMLFDPLHVPDYPLDSQFGEKLSGSLREAFYEGVGSGFAETLCRFWRMLLLPKDVTSPLYREMLEIEWDRCQTLMSRMSPAAYPLIERGFLCDLESRHFSRGIQNYLNSKFKRTENSLFQGDIWCKKVS
jgi:hypothetical protein